jgi:orotate phosphoribosyltransferase
VRAWSLVEAGEPTLAVAPRNRSNDLTELRNAVLAIVKDRGLTRSEVPLRLASGEMSHDFIDAKAALRQGRDLGTAGEAMLELAGELGIDFDAVGGLTLGADHFAHIVAYLADCEWFTVRKAVKGRGTNKRVEGAVLDAGSRVLLVDDVVTTGGSIREAYEEIQRTCASVTGAITLVDRGETAGRYFRDVGVPYGALVTYRDLGIEPIGGVLSA